MVDENGAYTDEALCDAQCGDEAVLGDGSNTVSITIKHGSEGLLGGGDVTVSLARIDNTHANAKATWEEMGQPGYLKKGQISKLVAASQLVEEPARVERVDAHTSRVTIALPPWSAVLRIVVSLLTISDVATVRFSCRRMTSFAYGTTRFVCLPVFRNWSHMAFRLMTRKTILKKQRYPVVIITWVQYLGPPGPFSFPDSRDLLEVLGGLPWQRESPREDPLGSGRIS